MPHRNEAATINPMVRCATPAAPPIGQRVIQYTPLGPRPGTVIEVRELAEATGVSYVTISGDDGERRYAYERCVWGFDRI